MGHEGALPARWPRRLQPAEHHPRAPRARSTSSTAGIHRSPRQRAPGLHWGSDHTGTEPACLRTAPGLSPNLANLPRHPGSSQVQKGAPQAVGVAAAPPGQCLVWLSPAHHTWSTAYRLASRAAGNPEHRRHTPQTSPVPVSVGIALVTPRSVAEGLRTGCRQGYAAAPRSHLPRHALQLAALTSRAHG